MNHNKKSYEFFLSKKDIRNLCFFLSFICFQCLYWLSYLALTHPETGQIAHDVVKAYIIFVLIFDVSYCFFVYNRYLSKSNLQENDVYLSDFFLLGFAGLFPFFYALMFF